MRGSAKMMFSGFIVLSLLILAPFRAESAMSSTNYEIQWDTVGSGGDDTSSSSSYELRDSVGGLPGSGSSSTYEENSGYRAGIYDQTVDYEIFPQDVNSQVAATALSGLTVSVTTSAGFTVGDMIAVVQDEGSSQVSAIGVVTSVPSGTSVVVDELHDNGTAPTIDGSNDYVYELTGSTMTLPSVSPTTLSTGIIGWNVNAEVGQGYSVYALAENVLTRGSNPIPDVTDGSVTIGSSEYGARSSDSTLASSTFDTQDTGFGSGSAPVQVASRSGTSFASRDFVHLKVAVGSSQEAGAYAQILTFIFVGDY